MADKKDDGGSAFPVTEFYDEKPVGASMGMSLRDYFAGQALALAAAVDHQQRIDESRVGVFRGYSRLDVAATAYAIADAMIAERSK